jgi:hypothetical protein
MAYSPAAEDEDSSSACFVMTAARDAINNQNGHMQVSKLWRSSSLHYSWSSTTTIISSTLTHEYKKSLVRLMLAQEHGDRHHQSRKKTSTATYIL